MHVLHRGLIVRNVCRVPAIDHCVDIAERKSNAQLLQAVEIIEILSEAQALIEAVAPAKHVAAIQGIPEVRSRSMPAVLMEQPRPPDPTRVEANANSAEHRASTRRLAVVITGRASAWHFLLAGE